MSKEHVYKTDKYGSIRYYSSKKKAEARFGPAHEVRFGWLEDMAVVWDFENGGKFGTIHKITIH